MAEDNSPQTDGNSIELDLTGIIRALDTQESLETARGNRSHEHSDFDPNATINYQQAGMPFPELPFAHEDTDLLDDPNPFREHEDDSEESLLNSRLDKLPGSRRSRKSQATAPAASHAASHSAAGRFTRASERSSSRAAQSALSYDSNLQEPSAYRPLNVKKPSYRIRGGGGSSPGSLLRSPFAFALGVVFLALGVGLTYYFINNFMGSLEVTSTGTEFDLTTAEARQALDSRLPLLIDYIDLGFEDSSAALSGAGQFVYTNSRYQQDSPDTGAESNEIVSMPQEMTEEQMAGYYQGAYSAYSPEELTDYFNGAYALDLARGELGNWNKLKYVNLNAMSLNDEIVHLAQAQQLIGDTVTITAQGVDPQGNTIVQGQKVISSEEGERVLYFRIAACPFKDIYSAQTLTEASVYLTCTLATYDFLPSAEGVTPAEIITSA